MKESFNPWRRLNLKKGVKRLFSLSGWHGKDGSIKITMFKRHRSETKGLCDFSIKRVGSDLTGNLIGFSGWIVGKNTRFDTIEIFSNGSHLVSIPVNIKRPDVAKHFSLSTDNDEFGFSAYFNPFLLSEEFELEGLAVSADLDKVRVRIFTMSGQRKQLHREAPFAIKPLLITTLGRTGSTYLLGLLGAHPNITVYRPFQVEARYASYWIQMFLSLGHPRSWLYPVASYDSQNPSWILGNEDERMLHHALYPEMFDWFDGPYMENLYRFCMESLQEHYLRIAQIQNKQVVMFFSEKFLPNAFTDTFLNLVPEAKEIVLTRDFRDMFCSIKAFNHKRGFLAFGRDKFASDEEYISNALSGGANALLQAWKKRRSRSLLVRYEDLVLEPESNLARIFKYLGVEGSPRTVRRTMEAASKTKPKSQKQHKTSPSAEDSLQRFRKELDPGLLKLCNRVFEEPLREFGYDM